MGGLRRAGDLERLPNGDRERLPPDRDRLLLRSGERLGLRRLGGDLIGDLQTSREGCEAMHLHATMRTEAETYRLPRKRGGERPLHAFRGGGPLILGGLRLLCVTGSTDRTTTSCPSI